MSSTTPAGWYQDGMTPGQERYWDGAQWTAQYRPVAPPAPGYPAPPPAPRPPSGFGISLREYWSGTVTTLRGHSDTAIDQALTTTQRGGSALLAWLIPLAINAIVFGFFILSFVGWMFQGARGLGGVLAGAYFIGLGTAAVYLLLRALAVRLTATRGGAVMPFQDALRLTTAAHLLDPYPIAVATLLFIIPGMPGLILGGIIVALCFPLLTTLAETAMYAATTRLFAFTTPPVRLHALGAGLSYGVAALVCGGILVGVISSLIFPAFG